MHTLHLPKDGDVLAQNEAVFDFTQGMSIAGDPKGRYRERRRYAERYGARYGERYGVGQGGSTRDPGQPSSTNIPARKVANYVCPPKGGIPGACGPYVTGQCGAAHGRRVYYDDGAYSCALRPPRCDCQVIGGNTLNSTQFPAGITTGAFGSVTLDSGDAAAFVPYYMHVVALEVGAVANLAVTGVPLLVLMQESLSGREPNMRRASTTNPAFGVPTLVYGQEKELECVDWNKFASINNQQLVITFNNPQTVSVHIFVNLWGLPIAG